MEHLIDILQLTTQEIDDMVATANDIIDHPDAYAAHVRAFVGRYISLSDSLR